MTISDVLSLPESKTLEFKRDLSSLKPVLRTLVAFANTSGGVLLVGKTREGEVIGVMDVLREEERLASAIADSIRPAMTPEIEVVSHEGKALLVVEVPHWRGPFYVRAEGPEKGVYIRLGSTTRRAGPEILGELQRSLVNRSFDQLPCPDVGPEDLDRIKIEAVLGSKGHPADDRALETVGALVPQAGRRVPSNGGVILFGRDEVRGRLFPDARVSCARFAGTDKTDFLDRLEVQGSVLEALEEVPRFIRRNTRLSAEIDGMRRRDIPEYSEVALREVLANAVAHADYSLTGMRILVAVYADRLEVQSPGMLPFGMTLDDLRAGVSRVRNRVIARVMRELGLIEEWGSGYRRVVDACRSGGYPVPEWQELGAVVRVGFLPHPASREREEPSPGGPDREVVNDVVSELVNEVLRRDLNERQLWILRELASGRALRGSMVVKHFGCSSATAQRDLAALSRHGVIEFVGAPKTGTYTLKRPIRLDPGRTTVP